jgi:hypothetical protein
MPVPMQDNDAHITSSFPLRNALDILYNPLRFPPVIGLSYCLL